jgi:hypothetical protein
MNRIWIAALIGLLAVAGPSRAGGGKNDIVTTAVEAG